jgi:hypothetical protein
MGREQDPGRRRFMQDMFWLGVGFVFSGIPHIARAVENEFWLNENEFPVSEWEPQHEYESGLKEININWEDMTQGQYYYGYVKGNEPSNVILRQTPDKNASIFKKYWLLPKTTLRVTPATNPRTKEPVPGWLEVVRDGDNSNLLYSVSDKYGIYIHISDLVFFDAEASCQPIDYVTTPENQSQKFIVVDKERREVTLFEGKTAILKTPCVLNDKLTVEGVFQVLERDLSVNMPSVQGVPFSNRFHAKGYYLHGSWHWRDWPHMTRTELMKSFTHGCVNLPMYVLSALNNEIPVSQDLQETLETIGDTRIDEFIFRWLGGQENASHTTWQMEENGVQIIAVPSQKDLKKKGVLPAWINPEEAVAQIQGTVLSVPEFFNQ